MIFIIIGRSLCRQKKPYARFIKDAHEKIEQAGTGDKGVYFVENHDTVTDEGRADVIFGTLVCDCFYVYLFTVNGTPMLYCGEEIADLNAHNMFANKDHNRGYGVDWSNALLPHGKRRFALIKKLAALRTGGSGSCRRRFCMDIVGRGRLRTKGNIKTKKLRFISIFPEKRVSTEPKGDVLLSRGYKDGNAGKVRFCYIQKIAAAAVVHYFSCSDATKNVTLPSIMWEKCARLFPKSAYFLLFA